VISRIEKNMIHSFIWPGDKPFKKQKTYTNSSASDNIGSIVSSKKIADSLTSYGRKTASVTVENYIEALTGAFVLYKAGRYPV